MLEDANVDYFNELDWISKLLEIVGKTLVDIKEDGFEKQRKKFPKFAVS